ncbi:chemotaxis protein CheD [Clostridium thailandense]|uniref:Probable chemoreceptor glutamine deamidase CheD n=1 Tax=Clostridium thailandense TaxID=2794346 RepID=A0A949WVK8_9CLOT|nr:chemotaxis protein CheD [Clostridium thailandense]MBV7273802.1 chemotaxis protein CheD [Clostridium thailandense]
MDIVVGIGDFAISNNEEDVIVTYALASCVAITVYSFKKKVAGMLHIALPGADDISKNRYKPSYYASTGIPLLFDELFQKFKCEKEELVLRIYGGADSIRNEDVFEIGRKNILAVKSILYKLNFKIAEEQIGGIISRTIQLKVSNGEIKVFTQPINI